jgi:hypothetical protein
MLPRYCRLFVFCCLGIIAVSCQKRKDLAPTTKPLRYVKCFVSGSIVRGFFVEEVVSKNITLHLKQFENPTEAVLFAENCKGDLQDSILVFKDKLPLYQLVKDPDYFYKPVVVFVKRLVHGLFQYDIIGLQDFGFNSSHPLTYFIIVKSDLIENRSMAIWSPQPSQIVNDSTFGFTPSGLLYYKQLLAEGKSTVMIERVDGSELSITAP